MTTGDPPRWSAARPILIGCAALAFLIGVLGVWSVQARIAGAVIAPGIIEVENKRQIVQHPQGGVVGAILAQDGDLVAAGDVVVRLDDTALQSDLKVLETRLYEIQARIARVEAERDGRATLSVPDNLATLATTKPELDGLIDDQTRLFEARRETLDRERGLITEGIAQTRNRIAGKEAQLAAFREQADLLDAEIADSQSLLDRGLAQASRVLALRRERARILGETGSLTASIAQLRGQIAELEIQALRLQSRHREEATAMLSDLRASESELIENRLSLRATLARMSIRSPVSGVIFGSRVSAVQAVISPAEPIMYVIPQDRPLIVSSLVPASHIDQVGIGQEVVLRFTSFDQRRAPEIFGEVVRLSADVFTDEMTGLAFYRAEVSPLAAEMEKLEGRALLPGMPVEAYFRTAERSPLSYLAKPILDYFNRAFREA